MGNCIYYSSRKNNKINVREKNICKKCNLKYYTNIRTCPHHRFRKNKNNSWKCIDCKLYRNKFGSTLCYHQNKSK